EDGACDQISEERIVETLPEKLFVFGEGRFRILCRRLGVEEFLRLNRLRRVIVWPRRAGTKQRCHCQDCCQLTHILLLETLRRFALASCVQNAWPVFSAQHRTPVSAAGRTGSRRSSR